MRILLVIPRVDTCYERVPSMGLMNLYLVAKEIGWDVELLDVSAVSYPEGLKKVLKKEYNIVGVSCNFTNAAPYCVRYPEAIKQKYSQTLMLSGGNHSTLVPEDILPYGYDYIIYGEGEITFKEFLKRYSEGRDLKDLKGIYYLKDGIIIRNPPRKPIKDLDTLPFNDFSEFNLRPYFENSGLRYISMETSRGCIYNCSFCSTVKMWGHLYRHKSPERILEEFKVAEKMDLDFVFIEDDDTALDEENLRNFCRLLIREKIKVPWGMGIGSISIKDESTLDIIKEAGCVKVNVNIESANTRLLRAYRKPYTIDDNRRLCRNLTKRQLLFHNHGIIGYPDETVWESLRTYFYLIFTSPVWHISILEPRPGSDYWKTWEKKGDFQAYRLFGKANVILGKNKIIPYLLYRLFAFLYFSSPIRIYKTLFSRNKGIRYTY
ncbi:MAG: radical SAM protein, partial [Candidatus Omnitrophica bacterium]|nr:radical SAM protein [Candidatus Omnitrophota bacterium]MBD3268927.1 radical SAM protein [Candidatus Omnitrophota bacterium]